VQSGQHKVDVPCGKAHENFEELCEDHGTT
jgi:hypothetical protein